MEKITFFSKTTSGILTLIKKNLASLPQRNIKSEKNVCSLFRVPSPKTKPMRCAQNTNLLCLICTDHFFLFLFILLLLLVISTTTEWMLVCFKNVSNCQYKKACNMWGYTLHPLILFVNNFPLV